MNQCTKRNKKEKKHQEINNYHLNGRATHSTTHTNADSHRQHINCANLQAEKKEVAHTRQK